jgi:S-DNA-T family DNA segregation ATPase FtsK/SpoIIIE
VAQPGPLRIFDGVDRKQEDAMRRACAMTVMVLLGCGVAAAQTAPTMPSIGATSPLGTLGSSPASGTGVPFGATEIDPGGLSPATSCVAADPSILGSSTTSSSSTMSGISGTGSTTSGSTFDGGGFASASNCSSVTPNTSNVTTTGIASPLSGSSTNLAGGTIPLGATSLDGGGLSPLVAVPQPVMPTPGTTTGCTGSTIIGSDPTTMSLNPGATFGTVPGC